MRRAASAPYQLHQDVERPAWLLGVHRAQKGSIATREPHLILPVRHTAACGIGAIPCQLLVELCLQLGLGQT